MNVFIAGGGRVGYHLAKLLCGQGENHDVTVIERDDERREDIDERLDVSTQIGDGTDVMLLQSLGVGAADLFVASMGNDEMNLIAAATAKGLGARQVVARVDNPMYVRSNILYETVLGVNYILSPDALAARDIIHFIEHPGIRARHDFGRGLVQMRQIMVKRTPGGARQKVRDLVPAGTGVLIGLIDRNGKHSVPHGDDEVHAGDELVLIGHRERMEEVIRLFQGEELRPQRVAIMGGAAIGQQVALGVVKNVEEVKVFERREDRCKLLAEKLHRVKVVCRDATSRDALKQEHIDRFDVFVAATNDDERNILAGVLAKEVGAKTVVAVVQQPDFGPLVERLDIDLAVIPRASVANSVIKLAHSGEETKVAVLEEGGVEILETPVGDGSPLLGKRLREISSKLPKDVLIATIVRGERVFVPGGDDEIHAGDTLVLLALQKALNPVRKLLYKGRG